MQIKKYSGSYITVTEENIHGRIYERVQLRAGVHVIPYKDKKIMMIHESRTHEKKPRWKLVSGWIDKSEKSIEDHAKEELAEEVGYMAQSWQEIYSSNRNDLTVSSHMYFYICEGLEKLEHPPKNPDIGCVVLDYAWFSFDEIFEKIKKGEILQDNSTMVALNFLYHKK